MTTEVITSHNDLYNWLSETLVKIDKAKLTDAFLYSLSSKDLTYRPYLACYVFASSIPEHNIDKEVYPSGNIACKYCGHCETYPDDTSHLESELANWGGVRVDQVFGATYYLDKLLSLDTVKPSKKDFDIFNNIIDTILLSDDKTKPRDKDSEKCSLTNWESSVFWKLKSIKVLIQSIRHHSQEKYRLCIQLTGCFLFVGGFETYNEFFGHYPDLVRL